MLVQLFLLQVLEHVQILLIQIVLKLILVGFIIILVELIYY